MSAPIQPIPAPTPTDWGATAAWIVLAVAIISPLLTTVFNSLFDLHKSKIEYERGLKQRIYEGYMIAVGQRLAADPSTTDAVDILMAAHNKLLIYATPTMIPNMMKVVALAAKSKADNTESILHIVEKIALEMAGKNFTREQK